MCRRAFAGRPRGEIARPGFRGGRCPRCSESSTGLSGPGQPRSVPSGVTGGSVLRAAGVPPRRAPSAGWTVGERRLCPSVSVAGRALEPCLPRAAGGWASPAPGNVQSPRTLPAPNLLLLFMALCCFLVPQPLSVSFQPQAAYVAQPQRCQLGLKPLSTVLFWEAPARCLQPGLCSEPSSLPAEPEKGCGCWLPLGELAQAGSVRALDRCPSFLPSLILSPPKSSWRRNCHRLLPSVWVGGSPAGRLLGSRESRWRGQGGRPRRRELCVLARPRFCPS